MIHRKGTSGMLIVMRAYSTELNAGARDSSEWNVGAGRGPRYTWLSANCTELGVIGCKLAPWRDFTYYYSRDYTT